MLRPHDYSSALAAAESANAMRQEHVGDSKHTDITIMRALDVGNGGSVDNIRVGEHDTINFDPILT